jgi:uncharacterized sulfatase
MQHNRRGFLGVAGAALAAGLASSVAHAAAPKRQPNFIVILCDDMGYGDIGPMGGRDIPTPYLDRMAREGITLTDYYAAANVCTPSRAGLLTGRYPVRTTMSRVLLANDKQGLPKSEKTIADALKPAYASALIGKWHLGHTGDAWTPPITASTCSTASPTATTFRRWRSTNSRRARRRASGMSIIPACSSSSTPAPKNSSTRMPSALLPRTGAEFAASAQLSGQGLCRGLEERRRLWRYGDGDRQHRRPPDGRLAALGLDRDTMVIFTSDNGPWFEGSTGGLRQRKGGGAYDGAYRVPFIARWPGTIPAARRSDAIAMGIDIMPTLCALAGLPQPAGVTVDGKDISGVLTRGGATPHEQLLLFQDEDVVGIRTQQWKYVRADFYMRFEMSLEGAAIRSSTTCATRVSNTAWPRCTPISSRRCRRG